MISNILGLAKGYPIPEGKFKIVGVFKIKEGKHQQYGDWSMQNIKLSDGTLSINATLKNMPELLITAVGQEVKVAPQLTKHGLKGAVVNEYTDKDGKVQKQIDITPSGIFKVLSESNFWAVPQKVTTPIQSTIPDTKVAEMYMMVKEILSILKYRPDDSSMVREAQAQQQAEESNPEVVEDNTENNLPNDMEWMDA